MKKLRSQILKFYVIGLVLCGLSLAAAHPVEAKKSSSDFTNWLQSVTKKAHTHELEDQLASLKKSQVRLYQLIEQASQIVSRNNDDFNLPLDASSASEKIHQILLVEWNQFQTGNAMTAIPAVPTVKSVIHPQSFKFLSGSLAVMNHKITAEYCGGWVQTDSQSIYKARHSITPMIGGIAIGAP